LIAIQRSDRKLRPFKPSIKSDSTDLIISEYQSLIHSMEKGIRKL
jgi:hypothetical protein